MTSRVLLLALMLTGAAAPHPDAPVKESAGRPVILIVHGRGFLSRDDLRGYLRDAGTARAIVGAWCDAADARRRFAGCLALARR